MIATPEALMLAESVPQALPLQPVPESAHVTPLYCESYATVAVNCFVCEIGTLALVGETLTVIG